MELQCVASPFQPSPDSHRSFALTLIFHCCLFKYGQGLPASELLGKTHVVSLKLHRSVVVKGVGGPIKLLYLTWKTIKDS